MLTRADFKTAAEHIAYTQGIIDAGRERVPMTEYERASLRLTASIEAHKHLLNVISCVDDADDLEGMCEMLAIGSKRVAETWLNIALMPDEET